MDIDAMRKALAEFRNTADERASKMKDSQLVVDELFRLYERFDGSEREIANDVVAEWVISHDEKIRFDALALIRHFGISSTVQSLQILAERLRAMRTPGAPFELKKVDGIIKELRNASSIVPKA